MDDNDGPAEPKARRTQIFMGYNPVLWYWNAWKYFAEWQMSQMDRATQCGQDCGMWILKLLGKQPPVDPTREPTARAPLPTAAAAVTVAAVASNIMKKAE
jgi:hypothetical protein